MGALAASVGRGEAGAQARASAGTPPTGGVLELPGKDRTIEPKAEPVFTVGVLDGEDWEMFGSVTSMAFDAAGNLYVLDAQAARVTVFGRDGAFLRMFGKRGRGPGELSAPSQLGVLDDGSVAVMDLSNGGIILFDAEGSHVGLVPVDPRAGLIPRRLLAQSAKGGFVSLVHPLGITIGPDGALVQPEEEEGAPVLFFPARDGGASEVIHRAWMPSREKPEVSASRGAQGAAISISALAQPKIFEANRFLAVLRDGGIVLSDSTAYSLKILSPEGKAGRRLHRPFEPAPVTKEIRERVEEHGREARERLMSEGAGASGSVVVRQGAAGAVRSAATARAGAGQAIRAFLGQREFAKVIAVVTALAADWEGRIWVRRAPRDGSHVWGEPGPIDLVTADGRYLGTIPPKGIRIPRAFGPGGLMAYYEEDEDGVPKVAVRRLTGVGR